MTVYAVTRGGKQYELKVASITSLVELRRATGPEETWLEAVPQPRQDGRSGRFLQYPSLMIVPLSEVVELFEA